MKSFVDAPHAAIDGDEQGVIVNLTDARAEASRRDSSIFSAISDRTASSGSSRRWKAQRRPTPPLSRSCRISSCRRITTCGPATSSRAACTRALAAAAECGPQDFAELLLVPGVGARTVRALALVAEVVHGAPYRFSDPARFSVAHGGKDRHPFPVPLKVYDRTIEVLKTAVQKAKLGETEELAAIKRLDEQARRLERHAQGPSVEALFAEERARSHELGGMSVFGPEPAPDAEGTPRRPARGQS